MKSPSRLFAICLATACLGAGLAASSATGAPAPAWSPIAHSGPTNLPPVQDEIQRLSVDAEGGDYTLTHTFATGTGTLSFTFSEFASYASDDTTIIACFPSGPFAVGQTINGAGIPAGTTIDTATSPANMAACFGFTGVVLTISAETTAGSGGFVTVTAASKEVTEVTTSVGAFEVGQLVEGTGIPADTTITAVGADTLTLSKFPTASGSQTLRVEQTTEAIDFNAAASAVETAIEDGLGLEVSVTGGPGGKGGTDLYFVTFEGDLKGKNVPQLIADSSALTGGDNGLVTVTTAVNGGPGTSRIAIYVQNIGGVPSKTAAEGQPTFVKFELPENITTSGAPIFDGANWACPGGEAGQKTLTCESNVQPAAQPGLTLRRFVVPVIAGDDAELGAHSVKIKAWGGGATQASEAMAASFDMPLMVSNIPAPPGLQAWTAGAYNDDGTVDTRAGAHPYSAATALLVNTVRSPLGTIVPAGEFRDIVADTPPGFLGNPIATEQCPEALEQGECKQDTIVASNVAPVGRFSDGEFEPTPVTNIQAPFGYPAKFRFTADVFGQIVINVVASLRSDEDYGLEVGAYNTPQISPVFGAFFTIWGQPAAAGHDLQRCRNISFSTQLGSDCLTREEILAEGGKDVAFLTNPVDCAEEAIRTPKATLNVNTWQDPTFLFAGDVELEPVVKCEELEFEVDKFAFEPDTGAADSPASFTTEFELPSAGLLGLDDEGNFDPEARMNPTIRETVIDLPEGVVLNASAADGLAACSFAQVGYKGNNFGRPNQIRFNKAPNTCPDASKIGSGELKSSLLEETLSADLFLAEQGNANPFGSLFAIYLVIENPRNGIFIKLPGEVQVNEQTGQQKIVFKDLPPLPFDSLKLQLKGGPRSPLATPTTCGTYATNMTNTPWSAPESGPPLVSPSAFGVNSGPNGLPCANTPAERPFNIGLAAGSTNPVAGAHSPFQIQLTRADGNQELDRLDIAMPPGFVASLKGIPYCSDAQIAAAIHGQGRAEQANPSCPAASRVGSTNSAAGSGPSPFYAPGALYLSGPYKGAPLSVVAITPAVAGPFDLGNVVVRSALHIDPVTARITAQTDPLPRILKGVPLRIRDVRVNLDRSNWAQNPTSCAEMAVNVTAYGSNGATSQPANRFQVGNCAALGFKPRMNLRLIGGTRRGGHPSLHAVVRPRPGDANIKRAAVTLPRSAFLDQSNIRTICTRVQWANDNCPKAARYGFARAWSPLLDQPLRGPVYLRSSNNELPDLVADLRGPAHQPIRVEAAFRTDSVRGGIRSTIEMAPDAPVSRFVLRMQGGKRKGLIVNSQNLCSGTKRATARLAGHNGRRSNSRPVVHAVNCKKQRKGAKQRGGKRSNLSQLKAVR